jgi:hypothetical protein
VKDQKRMLQNYLTAKAVSGLLLIFLVFTISNVWALSLMIDPLSLALLLRTKKAWSDDTPLP